MPNNKDKNKSPTNKFKKLSLVELDDHLTLSENCRDQQWEEQFLEVFSQSYLKITQPEPKIGPDGFSYLMVQSSDSSGEPALKVLSWLSKKGIGLVLNAHKEVPDYVFTYGMIWSFIEFGYFDKFDMTELSEDIVVQDGQTIFCGNPSSDYLPKYAREFLKDFFLQQQIAKPKVVMLSLDNKNFDFCWSLESLNNPPTKEHKGIADAIGWFLPMHYSIALFKEKSIAPSEFFDL